MEDTAGAKVVAARVHRYNRRSKPPHNAGCIHHLAYTLDMPLVHSTASRTRVEARMEAMLEARMSARVAATGLEAKMEARVKAGLRSGWERE